MKEALFALPEERIGSRARLVGSAVVFDSTANGQPYGVDFPTVELPRSAFWIRTAVARQPGTKRRRTVPPEELCLQQGTGVVRARFTPHHVARALGASRRLKDRRYLSANVRDTNGLHALAAGLQEIRRGFFGGSWFSTPRRKKDDEMFAASEESARDHPPTAALVVYPL